MKNLLPPLSAANCRPTAWAVLGVLAISGCATQEPGFIPPPLLTKAPPPSLEQAQAAITGRTSTLSVTETPKAPPPSKISTIKPAQGDGPDTGEANITLAFDQVELPNLIQLVYGNILKRNFSVDPAVSARKDLVTIRTATPQTPKQVAETARVLLKSYGIAVTDIGGLIRIVPDNTASGYLPEIRRGRALPDTPLPLRPVFYYVELQAVKHENVSAPLKAMFGEKIKVVDMPMQNAMLISGNADDITAALEAIHVLDHPGMHGLHTARVNPTFWSVDELSRKLREVLNAEGYSADGVTSIAHPIRLMPVAAINALIIVARDAQVLNHAVKWAEELDKPTTNRVGGGYFTYQALNTDASVLAKTLQELLAGTAAATQAAGQGVARGPARVVVSPSTNTLIVQAGADEYTQIMALLKDLDKPAKSALIEVTVAEVRRSDALSLGVEWTAINLSSSGNAVAGTLAGLLPTKPGSGNNAAPVTNTDGFRLERRNDARTVTAALQALATANRGKILSSPRIVARNGEQATIQVGQDVPVVTQQQSTGQSTTTSTGSQAPQTSTGILQTIQYRSTGVILKVKPVIYSNDRVDLEVVQEVSSVATETAGTSISPTVNTRKVDTKLTLQDGSAVLLGGLISSQTSQTERGVPLLKDIPGFGRLFKATTDDGEQRELLILITPYIISDDTSAREITRAFRQQLGGWAAELPTRASTTSSDQPR